MNKAIQQKYQIGILSAVILLGLILVGVRATEAAVTMTLGPGDSGDNVSELQRALAADSSIYPEGLVTGYYGSLTTAAVQRFQCKENIVCDGDVSTTGYGRVGPLTLAKIQLLSTPGAPNTGGDPSAVDLSAPIMTGEVVTTTNTTATIAWTTNEPSENRVMYGLSWPFYIGSAPGVSSPSFSTFASVTLTGLIPGQTYHYVRESVDAAGNVQYGIGNSFTTKQ